MIPPESLYGLLDFLAALREGDEPKTWARALEKTAASLGAASACHFAYDARRRQLVPLHSVGRELSSRAPVSAGEGLCGWVARYHEPLLAADAAGDERYRPELDGPARSLLCVPIFERLDFSGALSYADGPGPFTQEDMRFALAVSHHVALGLRRLKIEGMVNRVTSYNLSILDNLSGGFLGVDIRGRVMICNPAARRMLFLQNEVTDMPVEAALQAIPQLAAILRETLARKHVVKRQELRWSHAGAQRLLGYSTLLIQDTEGRYAGAGVMFQDITNIKKG